MIRFAHTLVVLISLFFLISGEDSADLDPETVQKRKDCIEICGGGKHFADVINKGELMCVSNWLGYKVETHSPCFLECMGGTPDEDQLKCLSEYCGLGSNYILFCSKPGGVPTPKYPTGKCDKVAKGEANFTRDCVPWANDKKWKSHDNIRERELKEAEFYFKKAYIRRRECEGKCGGKEHMKEAKEHEDSDCFHIRFPRVTSCIADCMDHPAILWHGNGRRDYAECRVKHCMASTHNFCTKPHAIHIKKEECDTLARWHKAGRYGNCAIES